VKYKVVINGEEQYSLWPAERGNPLGWNDAGKEGSKAECLDYIKSVWTDMRPLSLRKRMEELAGNPLKYELKTESEDEPLSLVERLSSGTHSAQLVLRTERTLTALKQCLECGYVHIKFSGSMGDTELGMQIDTNACNLSELERGIGQGNIHLEG